MLEHAVQAIRTKMNIIHAKTAKGDELYTSAAHWGNKRIDSCYNQASNNSTARFATQHAPKASPRGGSGGARGSRGSRGGRPGGRKQQSDKEQPAPEKTTPSKRQKVDKATKKTKKGEPNQENEPQTREEVEKQPSKLVWEMNEDQLKGLMAAVRKSGPKTMPKITGTKLNSSH